MCFCVRLCSLWGRDESSGLAEMAEEVVQKVQESKADERACVAHDCRTEGGFAQEYRDEQHERETDRMK